MGVSKARTARSADRLAAMRMNAIFRDLDPETVTRLLHYASFQSFKRGDFVFRKGDPGASLFGVIAGSVRMSASSADGKNAVLNLIGAGRTFGEIAVLDGLDRTTDAIANVDCELWRIERRDLMPLIQTQPALAGRFIDLLCARLRWTTEHLEQVVLQGLKARLAHMILKMAEQNLQRSGALLVDMSQQSISDVVGIARESANKIISTWAEQNWVAVENRTLVILDADALKNVAGRN
jgi:CRP/FNR family transcriptional regulator, cyclic AMP receptor protein